MTTQAVPDKEVPTPQRKDDPAVSEEVSPAPPKPTVSTFYKENVSFRAYKKYANCVWVDIQQRISLTSPADDPRVVENVEDLFSLIDPKRSRAEPIRFMVERFSKAAASYAEASTALKEAPPEENAPVEARLADLQSAKDTTAADCCGSRQRIAELTDEVATLQKAIDERRAELENLKTGLTGMEAKLGEIDAEEAVCKEELARWQESRAATDARLRTQEEAREELDVAMQEILCYTWEP